MEQIGEALPSGMQVAQLACPASGRQPPFSFMLPGCRENGENIAGMRLWLQLAHGNVTSLRDA